MIQVGKVNTFRQFLKTQKLKRILLSDFQIMVDASNLFALIFEYRLGRVGFVAVQRPYFDRSAGGQGSDDVIVAVARPEDVERRDPIRIDAR